MPGGPARPDPLAAVVVADFVACTAGNFAAILAIGLVAVVADQRTYPRGLAAHDIECIEAGYFCIKFRLSIFVE